MGRKIGPEYYLNEDVVFVAKDLLGKVICTNINGRFCSGYISETEAYAGVNDKASHAYGNLRSKRTEVMYHKGGKAYVYLCYGIHKLFNVVTGPIATPHAVLIRGIQPLEGIEIMEKRRKKKLGTKQFSSGPGTLTQALGIGMENNNTDLQGDTIWIEDHQVETRENEISIGPRIGIDYAGEDKDLPYRFLWQFNAK